MIEDWWYNQHTTNKTQAFVSSFVQRNGHYPDLEYVSFPYDIVYMIANAIETAGSQNPDAIVTALQNIHYTGILGTHSFTGLHSLYISNDPTTGVPFPLLEFENGNATTVFPSSIANGNYVPPTGNSTA